MDQPLCAAVLAKIHEQIERTTHLIRLLPADRLHDAISIPGCQTVAELMGHLLECLAGFCAVLVAAEPVRLANFAQLRQAPVNHPCDAREACDRIEVYRWHIDEGFALLRDIDLSRMMPTIFVKAGEPLLTLLLGNLEHLINHKHQLFTYAKLMGVNVSSRDLYRFRA